MSIEAVKFKARHHSHRACTFLVTGCVCLVAVPVLAIIVRTNPNTAEFIGFLGLAGFAMSILGEVMSILSFKERDIFVKDAYAAATVNGVAFLIYFILYLKGLF